MPKRIHVNRFSYSGHKHIIDTLIRIGANISAANNNGATALYLAAANGNMQGWQKYLF